MDTDPNHQMDFMAQTEHHCCAATLLMVILGGVKIYLDQRLELKQRNVIISALLKEKKYCLCIKRGFDLNLPPLELQHPFFQ